METTQTPIYGKDVFLTDNQIEHLRAMYPTHFDSATIEPGGQWCNEDGTSMHTDDPQYVTVTLFDKRAE